MCANLDSDTWDAAFLGEDGEDMDNHEDRIDDPPPIPKINSYKEAIQSLEDIQDFLERRGCIC